MLTSADMTPVNQHYNPALKSPSNIASNHEVYEVQWNNNTQSLKIFRIKNLLRKKSIHIASSKSQMSSQLKPIRLKHGTPNPAKALLLKLSVPQQFLYLSFEEDHNFVERTLINPDRNLRANNLEPRLSLNVPQSVYEGHPLKSGVT